MKPKKNIFRYENRCPRCQKAQTSISWNWWNNSEQSSASIQCNKVSLNPSCYWEVPTFRTLFSSSSVAKNDRLFPVYCINLECNFCYPKEVALTATKKKLLVFSRASSALQNFLNADGKDNKRNGEQHE